jgi:hypothetical protein
MRPAEGGTLVFRKALSAIVIIVGIAAVICCAKMPPPESPGGNMLRVYEQAAVSPESPFKGDAAILSDAEIAKILSAPVKIGGNNRLAVLKLSTTKYWSEEHATEEEANVETLLKRLSSAKSIKTAAELPRLLVPDKKTIPFLREAAARYQADLLLVYDTTVRTFTKYRTLGKDEVRAQCAVEAVLLDVRTGLVPTTSRRVEQVSASRSSADIDFSETIARTIAAAEGTALQGIAEDMITFLDAKP